MAYRSLGMTALDSDIVKHPHTMNRERPQVSRRLYSKGASVPGVGTT